MLLIRKASNGSTLFSAMLGDKVRADFTNTGADTDEQIDISALPYEEVAAKEVPHENVRDFFQDILRG